MNDDLSRTIAMLTRAGINHRYWDVKEREDGIAFRGTCLIVGAEDDGPYAEFLFDLYGTLVEVSPAYMDGDLFVVARTNNNRVRIETHQGASR